jgi:ferredoxin, 2Fe-2S
MAKVTFKPNKICPEERTVEVPPGTTLLEAAEKAEAPMGHNCGGVCACSTCHCYIRKGADSLTDQEDKEADRLDMGFDVRHYSRLGCQAEIEDEDAEIVVEITEESLKSYLDENPKIRKALEEKEKK